MAENAYYPRDIQLSLSSSQDARFFRTISPEGVEDDTDLDIDQWVAISQPAIWRGVNLICNSVAKARLAVKERRERGDTDAIDPYASEILMSPSPWMTPFDWKREIPFHALIWGNYFGWLKRDSRLADGSPNIERRPTEIRTLNPFFTGLVRRPTDNRIVFVTAIEEVAGIPPSSSEMQWAEILPENIVHVSGLSFMNGWGLPVIDFWASTVAISASVRKHGASFYGRGANPSGILRLPYGLSKEKRQDFIDSFSGAYTGMRAMNKVLVLEDDADFKTVTHSLDESQFSEVKRATDEDAARLLGLPPSSVGIAASVSYNSYEMARTQEIDHGIAPWLCNIECEMNRKCLRVREHRNQTHFFQFNRDDLVQVDDGTKREGDASDVNNGIQTVNQVLSSRGKPLSADPNADRLRKPLNIGYIDDPTPIKGEILSSELPDDPEENAENKRNLVRSAIRREVNKVCNSAIRAAKCPKKLDQWLTEPWGAQRSAVLAKSGFGPYEKSFRVTDSWQIVFFNDIKLAIGEVLESETPETYRDPAENAIQSHLIDEYLDHLTELALCRTKS